MSDCPLFLKCFDGKDCQFSFTVKKFDYLNFRTSIYFGIATLQQIFVLYVQNLMLAAFNELVHNIFNAQQTLPRLKH